MATNTLGHTVGVGDWVSWTVLVVPPFDPFGPEDQPLVPKEQTRIGQVILDGTDGAVLVAPLGTEAGPAGKLWLHPQQWRAALAPGIDARRTQP